MDYGEDAPQGAGDDQDDEPWGLPVSFCSAMDEDLAVPSALAAVHACVRDGNQALSVSDKVGARTSLVRLRAMLDVLGLDPVAPHWSGAAGRPGSGDQLRQGAGARGELSLPQRGPSRARRDHAPAGS